MYVDSDELLGTEILFANVLEPLNPPEVAAMLSALIFQVQSIVTYTDVCMYVFMYSMYTYTVHIWEVYIEDMKFLEPFFLVCMYVCMYVCR